MKDKEKAIEEMAKVIKSANEIDCIRTCDTCKYYDDNTKCISFGQSIALYNAGYRKLPEDSVVLSREELNDLDYKAYSRGVCCASEKVFEQKEKARKETAEKILRDLYSEATSNVSETVELTTFQIEQLAKQFGLEIKE